MLPNAGFWLVSVEAPLLPILRPAAVDTSNNRPEAMASVIKNAMPIKQSIPHNGLRRLALNNLKESDDMASYNYLIPVKTIPPF
jgi:hypothetical protein